MHRKKKGSQNGASKMKRLLVEQHTRNGPIECVMQPMEVAWGPLPCILHVTVRETHA